MLALAAGTGSYAGTCSSSSSSSSNRDSLAKKIEELDSRLTFVQRIVLSMCGK